MKFEFPPVPRTAKWYGKFAFGSISDSHMKLADVSLVQYLTVPYKYVKSTLYSCYSVFVQR